MMILSKDCVFSEKLIKRVNEIIIYMKKFGIAQKKQEEQKEKLIDKLKELLKNHLLEAVDYINTHKDSLIQAIKNKDRGLKKSWSSTSIYNQNEIPINLYLDLPNQEVSNLEMMIYWINNILSSDKRDSIIQILIRLGNDEYSVYIIPYMFFFDIGKKIIDYNDKDTILNTFDYEWNNFSKYLGTQKVDYYLLYPILSLTLHDSWELSSSVSIRQITEAEKTKSFFILNSYSTCIEVKKKASFSFNRKKIEEEKSLLFKRARDIINLLNLYFLAWIYISDKSYYDSPPLEYSRFISISEFKKPPTIFEFLESELKIPQEKKEEFQVLYTKFEDIYFQEKKLLLIMDRLSTLFSRTYEPDVVLDLVTIFEILLSVGTELSFRVAIYTASLLGQNSEKKKEIFQKMRNLYKLRNDITHGRDFQQNFEKYGDIELIKDVFRILRQILIKFLDSHAEIQKKKISFKKYIELNLFN